MKRIISICLALLLIAASAALALSCSDIKSAFAVSGIVRGKEYLPARVEKSIEVRERPGFAAGGSTLYLPVVASIERRMPEEYRLYIETYGADGTRREAAVAVSKAVYDSYDVGDWFDSRKSNARETGSGTVCVNDLCDG